MNGSAERMIKSIKKAMNAALKGVQCSFNELLTILQEAALVCNSRPLGWAVTGRSEDVEAGGPITPLHLLLGRATIEAPLVVFRRPSLTRRLQFVEDVCKGFWKKWSALVLQGADRTYKWRADQRNLQAGDVVLLKDETAATKTYRTAQVLYPIFSFDNKVRKVVCRYKNLGESKYRYTERPAQKVVLIVPKEEQEDFREILVRPPAEAIEVAPEDPGQPGEGDVRDVVPEDVRDVVPEDVQDMAVEDGRDVVQEDVPPDEEGPVGRDEAPPEGDRVLEGGPPPAEQLGPGDSMRRLPPRWRRPPDRLGGVLYFWMYYNKWYYDIVVGRVPKHFWEKNEQKNYFLIISNAKRGTVPREVEKVTDFLGILSFKFIFWFW
jgi:hypothetical protein